MRFTAELLAAAYLWARYSLLLPQEHFLKQHGLSGKLGAHHMLWSSYGFLHEKKILKTVWRYTAVLQQQKGRSKISGRNFADELMISGA